MFMFVYMLFKISVTKISEIVIIDGIIIRLLTWRFGDRATKYANITSMPPT